MAKNFLFGLIASVLGFASSAHAECAPQTNPCCEEACCSGSTAFVSADLLYLRASTEGINNCVTDFFSSDDIGSVTLRNYRGHSDDIGYKLKPGFRLGAGFDFVDCDWNVAAFWTHFDTHTNEAHGLSNGFHWNLHYDTIDIVSGQEYCLNHAFTLRPFGGLRFARIDQKLNLDALDIASNTTINERNKSKFLGAGPLVGLEGSWAVGCDFSVYANGGVSLLFGEFRNRFNGTEMDATLVDTYSTKQRQRSCLTALDAGLGVRWIKSYCGGSHLMVQLGLELHKYYNANRLSSYGDLTLDGFNLSASYFY